MTIPSGSQYSWIIAWSLCFIFAFGNSAGLANNHQSRHLIVAGAPLAVSLEIARNATGHIVDLNGVSAHMLDWLTHRYKFNYSILQVNDSVLEPTGTGENLPGLISYIIDGKCDVLMAAIKVSPDRFRHLDFVHPWMYARSAFLIPMPGESRSNLLAVVKPFHFLVWITLLATVVAVAVALFCFSRFRSTNGRTAITPVSFREVSVYVLATLLNQGGRFSRSSFKVRFIAGAWCLVALVLTNVYEGILISYVTSKPREKPLVESPDDVLNNVEIQLVVDQGQGADVTFSTAESGIFKLFGDKLRAYPKSRCLATHQCIDLVKSAPHRHVYFNTRVVLLSVIYEDRRRTGHCNLVEAGERYSDNTAFCWGLKKNSPYTEQFNRGVLSMREMGLVSVWEKWFEPNVRPCLVTNSRRKKKKQKKPLVRLTVTHLTGAFALLGIGYAFSLITLVLERMARLILTKKYRVTGFQKHPWVS